MDPSPGRLASGWRIARGLARAAARLAIAVGLSCLILWSSVPPLVDVAIRVTAPDVVLSVDDHETRIDGQQLAAISRRLERGTHTVTLRRGGEEIFAEEIYVGSSPYASITAWDRRSFEGSTAPDRDAPPSPAEDLASDRAR